MSLKTARRLQGALLTCMSGGAGVVLIAYGGTGNTIGGCLFLVVALFWIVMTVFEDGS